MMQAPTSGEETPHRRIFRGRFDELDLRLRDRGRSEEGRPHFLKRVVKNWHIPGRIDRPSKSLDLRLNVADDDADMVQASPGVRLFDHIALSGPGVAAICSGPDAAAPASSASHVR